MTETSELSSSSVRAAHEGRIAVGRLRRRLRESRDPDELTPTQPALLSRLLHAPDRLRVAASQIELVLQVPDCTGGAIAAPAPHAIGA